ncbi:MAG TPA: hypothetical protein VLA72_16545 [Anaerolineales bacterium]|nr:hypothetical protein [Anaerolineales bacterium]
MSKKNKKYKKQRKKEFPLPLVVFGGILIFIAVILYARQGGGNGGTPVIVVDQQRIDYGDVKFNVSKSFAIKVTNTGDGTLRFKEEPYIQVLEGC